MVLKNLEKFENQLKNQNLMQQQKQAIEQQQANKPDSPNQNSELSSPKIISVKQQKGSIEIRPAHPKKHLSKSYCNKIDIL